MSVGISAAKPRVPKGTPAGGQWVSTNRPREALTNDIGLASKAVYENVPLGDEPKKLKLTLLDRQRTLKHDGEKWGIHKLPLASRIVRKMSDGLEVTIQEAVDLSAVAIVDMLNEGSIDLNVYRGDDWIDESYIIGDIGRGVINGVYKALPSERRDYSKIPEAIGHLAIVSTCGTTPEKNLIFSLAKLKGLQLGYEMELNNDKDATQKETTKAAERDLVRGLLYEMSEYSPLQATHGTKRQIFKILGETQLPHHQQSVLVFLKEQFDKEAGFYLLQPSTTLETPRQADTALKYRRFARGMTDIALGVLGSENISDQTREDAFELLDELVGYPTVVSNQIQSMVNWACHPHARNLQIDELSQDMLLALVRATENRDSLTANIIRDTINHFELLCFGSIAAEFVPGDSINRLRSFCSRGRTTLLTIRDQAVKERDDKL